MANPPDEIEYGCDVTWKSGSRLKIFYGSLRLREMALNRYRGDQGVKNVKPVQRKVQQPKKKNK